MILSYSRDCFVSAIQSGTKIHTIREDFYQRWKPGMSIQHWRGNPRNVRSNPYPFGVGECKGVQEINVVCYLQEYDEKDFGLSVVVDDRVLSPAEIETLAINDGLSVAEFKQWFTPPERPVYTGRIIHFTEKRY